MLSFMHDGRVEVISGAGGGWGGGSKTKKQTKNFSVFSAFFLQYSKYLPQAECIKQVLLVMYFNKTDFGFGWIFFFLNK